MCCVAFIFGSIWFLGCCKETFVKKLTTLIMAEMKAATTAAAAVAVQAADVHVTWDEETIARHDLDRGSRMKIEEPNTPFHYYDSDQDGDDADHSGSGPVSPARSLSGKENRKMEVGTLRLASQTRYDTMIS